MRAPRAPVLLALGAAALLLCAGSLRAARAEGDAYERYQLVAATVNATSLVLHRRDGSSPMATAGVTVCSGAWCSAEELTAPQAAASAWHAAHPVGSVYAIYANPCGCLATPLGLAAAECPPGARELEPYYSEITGRSDSARRWNLFVLQATFLWAAVCAVAARAPGAPQGTRPDIAPPDACGPTTFKPLHDEMPGGVPGACVGGTADV
jgi:hypothetical protein